MFEICMSSLTGKHRPLYSDHRERGAPLCVEDDVSQRRCAYDMTSLHNGALSRET